MGRHAAQLFPNAQRAQHYGTPPPAVLTVAEPAEEQPEEQTEPPEPPEPVEPPAEQRPEPETAPRVVLPPLPSPPTELIMPDGRVVPLILHLEPDSRLLAPAPAAPLDGPEWGDAPADPRALAGGPLPGLPTPKRGRRGRSRKADQ